MSEASKPVWSAGFKTVTVQETEEHVAADIRVFCGNPDFTKRISRLIAEAGTVHHETGLTPRQLVEQRDALLAALAEMYEFFEPNAWGSSTNRSNALINALATLALVKGEKP